MILLDTGCLRLQRCRAGRARFSVPLGVRVSLPLASVGVQTIETACESVVSQNLSLMDINTEAPVPLIAYLEGLLKIPSVRGKAFVRHCSFFGVELDPTIRSLMELQERRNFSWLRRENLPPRFTQCEVCFEFNGTTDLQNLSWYSDGTPPTHEIGVTCLCQGDPVRAARRG